MIKSDFIFSLPQLKEYLFHKGIKPLFAKKELTVPFFLLIPKYYVDLIDWNDAQDPLFKMVVTTNLEKDVKDYEMKDPIGDASHSPIPGIVQRYPDRCLLMLTNVCAVHCRFCFRKNLLEENNGDYNKSIGYIKNNPAIWEVILSGGDPFMFTDHFMQKVITDLNAISHVKVIRFHTRTPVVYPQRVTKEVIKILSAIPSCIIVLHINHPNEITKEFAKVVKKFKKIGVLLLSQTVLMKDVNDDARILEKLFKGLVEIGVKPYYLHHLDVARGTHHFRISVEKGKQIMQNLRGNISGVCIPEYILDVPGGFGKIPVSWFEKISEKEYQALNFKGEKIIYHDYV